MHRIDRLEIFGFKSFCEKTDLILNGEVTAIVGPNGCGKSNVADAINWVLGEQSTKSLRAGKMEDVIFNGTQRRKSLGLAEVTLTLRQFSNGSVLPVEPPQENGSITVSRRLYRSGESEYFLNGRRCRLKDVHEFFEGTGLGSTSYALIEQGKIEVILGSKPQDRRQLLEEAARISIFKTKRKAAEVKLELSRQNLARVNDIIHEVDRQMASLKRQAAKTRRYYRLRDELKFFSRINFWNRSRTLVADTRRIQEQLESLAEDELVLAQRLSAEGEARRRLIEEVERRSSDLVQLRDELSTLRLEEERASQQQAYQESRMQSLRDRAAELEEALADSAARSDRAQQEAADLYTTVETLATDIAAGNAEAQSLQGRVAQLTDQIEAAESELNALRNSTLGEVEQLAGLRNRKGRVNERLEMIARQWVRLDEETARLELDREALDERRHDLESLLDANAATTQTQRQTLTEADAHAAHLRTEGDGLAKELDLRTRDLQSRQHRLASLDEIEAHRTNYSEGVKRFLNAGLPLAELQISGTLADFIETDPRLEAVVEGFMDAHLQHVVVETLDAALRSLSHVHDRQTGRCSFMVIESLNGGTTEGHPPLSLPEPLAASLIGRLYDLLSIAPKVKEAVTRAFPDLSGVIVVSDLQAAQTLARRNTAYTFLTLQGDVVSGRGRVSILGERREGLGFLSLKRERKELATRIEHSQADLQTVAARLEAVTDAREANDHRRQALSAQLHQLELERSSLKPQLDQALSELARLVRQTDALDQERERLAQERSGLITEQESIDATLRAMESAGRTRAERLLSLEETLPSQKRERDDLLHTLGDFRMKVAERVERQRSVQMNLQRLSAQSTEQAALVEKMRRELAQAQATVEQLRHSNEELQLKAQAQTSRRLYLEEALQSEQAHITAQKDRAHQLEDLVNSLQEQRQALRETRSQLEVDRARHENDLQHLQAGCREEFHEDLEGLARNMTEEQLNHDPALAEQSYLEVKQKLEDFGAINMSALEEYQQLEERYNFLLSQQADIQTAIQSTQDALMEINRRSAEQFRETFETVNRNFKEIFNLLFGGGHCEMRLLDDADVLESGIEIIAQPPGKRLQNVMLLSGGEKALVALALLLGIFKFRPSPFCLLDEVDAPLDDANIGRFTRLLTEMGKDTQFILITHNKRTMEVAQYLYGVTMQEAGVSKVVSVKFE